MKRIVLSADGDRMVYLVPDEVAEQLERYCDRFWTWMQQSRTRQNTGWAAAAVTTRRISSTT